MSSQLTGNTAFFSLDYSPLNQQIIAACADRHIRLYDPRVVGMICFLEVFIYCKYSEPSRHGDNHRLGSYCEKIVWQGNNRN